MDDPRKVLIAIDANVFDVKDEDYARHLERFEQLIAAHRVRLLVTESVWREVSDPNTPAAIFEKYKGLAKVNASPLTDEQILSREATYRVLTGRGQKYRHSNDAHIVSDAAEADARYLLTEDQRLLNKEAELRVIYPKLRLRSLGEFLKLWDEFERGLRT